MSSLENNSLESKQISLQKILGQMLQSLFYPQIALLLFLPILISIITVSLFIGLTWSFWSGLFQSGLLYLTPFWQTLLSSLPLFLVQLLQGLAPFLPVLFFIMLFALAFPLIVVLNLLITSVLASNYLVNFIARKDFPDLQKKGQGRWALELWNSISASFLFLLAWIVTFPLWLIPLAQLILPVLLTAWLNRKICSFDTLTEFADDHELKTLPQRTAGRGYVLGLITAGFNYFPLAIFFSPVLTMVAFIYMNLGNLRVHRDNPAL